MMLDEEIGFFSANMLFAIEEIPKDDPNVVIWQPTTLYSKYYQEPFKGLKKEIFKLANYVRTKEKKEPTQIYTWVTNCPRCWENEGSPTTVIFARIQERGEDMSRASFPNHTSSKTQIDKC